MNTVQRPEIKLRKKETEVELRGLKPSEVTELSVYSDDKAAALDFLRDYPALEYLFIRGDFASVDGISLLGGLKDLAVWLESDVSFDGVRVPPLKRLSIGGKINAGLARLALNTEYLELLDIRGLSDLSFLEDAGALRKLYLKSLPSAEALPDLGKMPRLYGLKVYELHKLNDIEPLERSSLRFLDLTLTADKISGTKLAEILLKMEGLERFSGTLDRSAKRDAVLENRLNRAGRSELWKYFPMDEWLTL